MNTLGWQELKVVALAVDDLARAADFYQWVGAFLDSEGNKLWFCSEAKQPAPRA